MHMARPTKKSGFAQILSLPWQAQLLVAAIAMLVSAFLPEVTRHPSLAPLVKFVAQLAWFVAFVFASLGVISYGIKRYREEHPFGLALATPSEGTTGKEKRPQQWSLELLRELEWKRFELLCGAYHLKQGLRMETIRRGADGGIDAKLYSKLSPDPVAMIHCRAWSGRVGVEPVRDLLGVMARNHVAKGIFHATGTYTEDAVQLAQQNAIKLVNGSDFLQAIGELPDAAQDELLNIATEGAFTTPTCPSCGIKMVMRDSETGYLWGCTNHPRCRQTFELRAND